MFKKFRLKVALAILGKNIPLMVNMNIATNGIVLFEPVTIIGGSMCPIEENYQA